ncbi:AAA family ATPase [Desulfococcaceae bacterium HSG8]|nr:AAA family ATPase [Desulfococcaceae bacterium HSG8]
MIESIEIRNFRCFEHTRLSGFKRINLIGGKNNSGKTALLEALYLNSSPAGNSVMFLIRLRGEYLKFIKALPERAWNNFFFNQNKNEAAILVSENEDKISDRLELSCDDAAKPFSRIIEEEEQNDEDMAESRDLVLNREYKRSELYLNRMVGDKRYPPSSMIAYAKGIAIKEAKLPDIREVKFVPASSRLSRATLAQEFDKADLNGNADKVLEAIRIIDPSVVQIKTLNIGEPAVYLRRENQGFLPLTLFGEAMSKITDFVLRLVNTRKSILLIDEIENGIHYSNQHSLWQMLFRLSLEFDIQVFSTTHSLEMIQTFSDVGLESGIEDAGVYFELARNVRTGQITGIRHELETLDYAVKRKMGVRGEQRFNRREQK